jgi:hypothetical protein
MMGRFMRNRPLLMIFTNIESANYRVLWGTGAGKGTFIIERVEDGATTLRFTGSEGADFFQKLKGAWCQSRLLFDSICRGGGLHPMTNVLPFRKSWEPSLERLADNLWMIRLDDSPETQAQADRIVKELRRNNYVVPDYMKGD